VKPEHAKLERIERDGKRYIIVPEEFLLQYDINEKDD